MKKLTASQAAEKLAELNALLAEDEGDQGPGVYIPGQGGVGGGFDYDESITLQLYGACKQNLVDLVKSHLDDGVDPSMEVKDPLGGGGTRELGEYTKGDTCLHAACRFEPVRSGVSSETQPDIIDMLLAAHTAHTQPAQTLEVWVKGCTEAIQGEPGWCPPPLHIALRAGNYKTAVRVLAELKTFGKDQTKQVLEGIGERLFHFTVVKGSNDPHACAAALKCLCEAAQWCGADMALLLGLEPAPRQVPVTPSKRKRKSVLVLLPLLHVVASTHGQVPIAEAILNSCGKDLAARLLKFQTSNPAQSCLIFEGKSKKESTWDPYVEYEQWTVLMAAAWHGHPELVSFLLSKPVAGLVGKPRTFAARKTQQGQSALTFAQHRASNFQKLVDGAKSGVPAPDFYEVGNINAASQVKYDVNSAPEVRRKPLRGARSFKLPSTIDFDAESDEDEIPKILPQVASQAAQQQAKSSECSQQEELADHEEVVVCTHYKFEEIRSDDAVLTDLSKCVEVLLPFSKSSICVIS